MPQWWDTFHFLFSNMYLNILYVSRSYGHNSGKSSGATAYGGPNTSMSAIGIGAVSSSQFLRRAPCSIQDLFLTKDAPLPRCLTLCRPHPPRSGAPPSTCPYGRSSSALESKSAPPVARGFDNKRPRTTSTTRGESLEYNPRQFLQRPKSRACWRWRVGILDTNLVSPAGSLHSTPIAPVTVWGSAKAGMLARATQGSCGCCCPMDRCRVCSPTVR